MGAAMRKLNEKSNSLIPRDEDYHQFAAEVNGWITGALVLGYVCSKSRFSHHLSLICGFVTLVVLSVNRLGLAPTMGFVVMAALPLAYLVKCVPVEGDKKDL